MIKRLSTITRWSVCGLVLAFGAIQASAQDATNAPAARCTRGCCLRLPPAAPAAPAAPKPTTDQRLADLEAYVNNGAPGGDQSPALPSNLTRLRSGHNAWMMDFHRVGVDDDVARSGSVLRRFGSPQERPLRLRPVFCDHRLGDHSLVALRLRAWSSASTTAIAIPRRAPPASHPWAICSTLPWAFTPLNKTYNGDPQPQQVTLDAQRRVWLLDVAECLLLLPADLRHHHPGPHRGRHRGTNEILRLGDIHRVLDVHRLLPAGPQWCGVLTVTSMASGMRMRQLKAWTSPGAPWCICRPVRSGLTLALIIGKRLGWG